MKLCVGFKIVFELVTDDLKFVIPSWGQNILSLKTGRVSQC